MTHGAEFGSSRTLCPADGMPTVAQVLQLPPVLTGDPQVFADQQNLARPIRWAHVLENMMPRDHLRGGEMVLTTGIGWGPAPDFTRYVRDLALCDVPLLVLELGTPVSEAPQELVQACREAGLALVIMHRKVAFVEITGALHEWLFSEQTRRIEAGGTVTVLFTALMQRGAPTDSILSTCAQLLGTPVILEDQGYHVLRYAPSSTAPQQIFESWQEHSGREHRAGNPGRHAVPVTLHGKHFGSLICSLQAQHPAGVHHVLTMAAVAIGVDLLQRPGSARWELGTGQQLLDDLLVHKKVSATELVPRFEASGLPIRGRILHGFAVALAPQADPGPAAESLREALAPHQAAVAHQVVNGRSLLFGLLSLQEQAAPFAQEAFEPGEHLRGPLYLGPGCHELQAAADSLRQARAGFELHLGADGGNVVHTAAEPLALLAHELRHEPSLQRLPRQVLAPVLDLPQPQRTEFLRILEACVAHPANRSLAARHSLLSRSVFYQRLSRLEELLGISLDDPRLLTVLSLALAVHRQSQRSGRPPHP
ncbi:PucR family transcriptional regulator [Glutamicibacter sp. V16R2B1]|uniref:PucR family transcriptional regulator n=1 Tax=Glutamicibacter sp. V16R2B1 TaxID=2036207 RepID=UPI00128219CB|nr:PucR family transcriptional regulator [Glutamicibacter sp. V16R2B1]TLK52011.1 hypothetical protein FDN03_09585 [Glutamicibacter sp. V16R2B1]